jgi:hypothetical protein
MFLPRNLGYAVKTNGVEQQRSGSRSPGGIISKARYMTNDFKLEFATMLVNIYIYVYIHTLAPVADEMVENSDSVREHTNSLTIPFETD